MTKPQKSQEANWKVVKTKTPTYTTFYLILLILLTISTFFGLFGLGSIDTTIASIKTEPGIGYIMLAQQVLPLVMAIGLLLLYKKDKRGLSIILATYGVAVLLSILFLFFKDPLVQDIAGKIVQEGKGDVTNELAKQIAGTIFTVIPILNIAGSILFGILWYFAWKKQTARDNTASGSKNLSV